MSILQKSYINIDQKARKEPFLCTVVYVTILKESKLRKVYI